MAEIKLIIEMDGQQTVVKITDKVGDSLKKMGGATEEADKKVGGLKNSFKSLMAAGRDLNQSLELIKKGIRAIKIGIEFARAGAIFQEQTLALDALGKKYGETAQSIVEQTRLASGGMASMRDATKQAAKAITLGLKPDVVVKFAKIARASAKAMGTDFNFMFESITTGVSKQSKLLLDNLGIIVNVEEANRRYAEQVGILASELTEVQRRQAFTNEALRQGQVIVENMAGVMDTTADKFREASAAYDDFVLSLQEGAAQDIDQTKVLEGGTLVLQFLTEWQNEANEFKKILGDVNAVAGKSMDGLINSASDSRKELETLRDTLRGLSRGELVELSAFAALSGNTVTDLADRIDLAIQSSDNSAKSWQTLTSRIFKNVEALGAARKFINKVRAAAAPGMDFIMRIRARISGVAGAILEFLGIIPKGASKDVGGGGRGAKAVDPEAEALKTIKNLVKSFERLGKTKLELAIAQLNEFAEKFPKLSADIIGARMQIEMLADEAEKMKRFNKRMKEAKIIIEDFVRSSMTEADILRERAKLLERTVNLRRQEVGILEANEDLFVQRGEAAIAILLEQARLQEKIIEIARLDNELAGKGILNDLTQMQILENTIELRKTEIEIAKQRAEIAEREEQAQFERRFGPATELGFDIEEFGGFRGVGGDLEQLQLAEDQKFEVLHMAFVREFERRREHFLAVQEMNKKIIEEGRRVAQALVAGGFEVIGRGLGDMIAGTKQGGQEFGKAMQALVGEAATQFGKFLITFGTGNVVLGLTTGGATTAQGVAQIAAGVALVALGRAAAAAAQAQPTAAAGAAGGAPGGRAGGIAPSPQPIPAETGGGGFVVNIFAEGDIVDITAFTEERIIPALANAVGAGNLGSAEFNVFAQRE